MSKAILLSIKPKWVAKIMNGDKTIEVRKNKALYKATMKLIEEQGYATFFMYCSKGSKKDWHLIEVVDTDTGKQGYEYDYYIGSKGYLDHCLEGKVVAKFTVRKVEEFTNDELWENCFKTEELITKSCVPFPQLMAYSRASSIYAYHIEDLVIFDKPKELSDFYYYKGGYLGLPNPNARLCSSVSRAPQNFIYVESEE